MDRSGAATTLFLWQFEGARDLVGAASRTEDRTLLSVVESLNSDQPARPVSVRRPASQVPLLRLQEEDEASLLRERLAALVPSLNAEERQTLQEHLRPDLIPMARLARVRKELERMRWRVQQKSLHEAFEENFRHASEVTQSAAPVAVFLLSRDGQVLASEGDASRMDITSVASLVARGDAGSTWNLTHDEGAVLGHIGQKVALVAVFASRPKSKAGIALRTSLESLERRPRLVSELHQPGSHQALTAFVRAVQALLVHNA